MTREEIKEMKPGKELNLLVSEEVMRWLRPKDPVLTTEAWLTFFRPSTDIAAAWRVVEEMHKKLFSVRMRFLDELQALTAHEVPGIGEVRMTAWPDVFWTITPERICKAALLTKEAE